jgi:diguanylate cyclase (GGDEF)-like protein
LFVDTSARGRDSEIQRWETTLGAASEARIEVEVVCRSLGRTLRGVKVYGIRDLRERREATEERDRQNSALQRHEQELRIKNMRFDTALNNMSQGLAMFDAEHRLVVCNRLYSELYGLSPEQVKPGTTIRQLLEYRHTKGVFGNIDFESFARDWLAEFGQASSRTQKLADGRVFLIVRRPMLDGGLVSTTEDITERQRLNARLEQQNLHLDAALKYMCQGLCMFDAEGRLVIANDRYADMYGLLSEDVQPGTPFRRILERRIAMGAYVGDDPEEYIAERLAAVRERNASTKVHTLCDGRVFAISHQPMADGGWVATHQDITEQRRSEAKIAHMAHHDALTGLPNRVFLRERLEHALASRRGTEGVAVLCLDLDHFKEVNDTLGHPIGDALLKSVGERLRNCMRETDTVARVSGDEFVVVQVSSDPPKEATALATRLTELLSAPHTLDGHQVVVGTSIGIAISPNDGSDPDVLLKHADLALYGTKAEGRGTYRFFESEMNTRMQARRSLEADLRKALSNGEFELHYQPLVNLENHQVVGMEALLRWNQPERGKVSPADFIPLSEETGLIVPIGEWVLRQACREAAAWPEHVRVSVNVSAAQFKKRNLVQTIFNALAASSLPASRLELEITESVLIQDGEATLATLCQLRDLGVRIALDDFGTGYSSLSYLRSFPFDKIKIDRCFVKDLTDKDDDSLAIVRAVARLGHSLGMMTTAEGVESKEQMERVRAEGCTEMQGYYFSPPKTAAEISRQFFPCIEKAASAA